MPGAQPSFRQYYGTLLRGQWTISRAFRAFLVVALVFCVLRLIAQAVFTIGGTVSDQVGVDLQVYLEAAGRFVGRQDLYPTSLDVLESHFPYPPIFALLFVPFLWLPVQLTVAIHFILHLLVYYLLFVRWGRIFQQWNQEKASRSLILSLPVWLLFTAFWDDLAYLNIYLLMALMSTLLIEAVLKDNLPQASIWLTLILVTKPQWAFAAAVPLFLGRYRFLLRMIVYSLAGYLAIGLITALAGGPAYVWGQFKDYVDLLVRLGRDFPWRGPEAGFLGYNHSIKQILAFYLGNGASVLMGATIVKIVLLVPVSIVAIHRLLHPIQDPGAQFPGLLGLVFCLYLGVFIWLDIVWEVSLSIAIYGYLMIEGRPKSERIIAACAFLPYALLDVWRLLSYLAGSPLIDDAYLQWDYSIYIPTTMIAILTFHAILIGRIWPRRSDTPGGRLVADGGS
jgi:hypothetical protein